MAFQDLEAKDVVDFQKLYQQINFGFGPGTPTDLGGLITVLLPFLFAGAGILLLLYLIYGGLEFMTSGGDPKRIQASREKLTNALIGFLIVFVAYWIVGLLGQLLNLTAITNIFK